MMRSPGSADPAPASSVERGRQGRAVKWSWPEGPSWWRVSTSRWWRLAGNRTNSSSKRPSFPTTSPRAVPPGSSPSHRITTVEFYPWTGEERFYSSIGDIHEGGEFERSLSRFRREMAACHRHLSSGDAGLLCQREAGPFQQSRLRRLFEMERGIPRLRRRILRQA